MKQAINKSNSIYTQLLFLLCIGVAAAVLVFAGAARASDYLIETVSEKTDYEEKREQKYISNFQKYVTVNDLSVYEFGKINRWVNKQGIISLEIYRDDKLVYNSSYSDMEEIEEKEIDRDDYDWMTYYTVTFAEGDMTVGIFGAYTYRFYHYANICSLILSFVVFLAVILLGIRKKMRYIRTLKDEIEILEGGNLDCQITVKGQDELGMLAYGLDCMRLSLKAQMESEAAMAKENQRIITEMSHDIRTPITSIMLYTEILEKGAYKNEDTLLEYLGKIERKSQRMKQLTDNLFQYSLTSARTDIQDEDEKYFQEFFYDVLSETCGYLGQQGFEVDFQPTWPYKKIRANLESIARVIDNVSSNLMKYADPKEAVVIRLFEEGDTCGILFRNKIKQDSRQRGTGIGLQSIKNIMDKLHGTFEVTQEEAHFQLKLVFQQTETEQPI